MKKLLILTIILIGIFTSCSTPHQTTNYEKTYTFKRGNVTYKVTDIYKRIVETDTIQK